MSDEQPSVDEVTKEMYKTPYGTIYYIVKRLRWRYLWEK